MTARLETNGHRPAPTQLTFTWLPDKPMLKISDIIAATGMEKTYLEEYFARKCHRFPRSDSRPRDPNEKQSPEEERAARPSMRVPRAFALELLVTSAQFTADEKREAVGSTFPEFGLPDLLKLSAQLQAEIRRKS